MMKEWQTPLFKTMKTLIGINNLIAVDQYAYANHLQVMFRLGVAKGRANMEGQEVEFALCNPRRMSIDRMRNEAAKIALEGEFDYLWFIDDDVLLPLDAFTRLQQRNKDIIAGVTLIRGYPFHPMIFNFTDPAYKKNSYVVDYQEKAGEDGLLECDAVGFSCCLIKVEVLKNLIPPFFVTTPNQTEDVYFCKKAKAQYPDLKIFADVNVKTGHLLGNDIIEPSNRLMWMKFEEERNPSLLEQDKREQERIDRSPEQVKALVESI